MLFRYALWCLFTQQFNAVENTYRITKSLQSRGFRREYRRRVREQAPEFKGISAPDNKVRLTIKVRNGSQAVALPSAKISHCE
jgi:hypothetical protein